MPAGRENEGQEESPFGPMCQQQTIIHEPHMSAVEVCEIIWDEVVTAEVNVGGYPQLSNHCGSLLKGATSSLAHPA